MDTAVLDRILVNLPGNTQDAVRATAFWIEGKAKTLAPVDTGALRSSIYTRVGRKLTPLPQIAGDAERVELPQPENENTAHVGPSVKYGIYVELGTERASAQPYLGPAISQAGAELERNMRGVVDDG